VSYGRCHCVSCIACLFLTDITFHDSPHFLHLCCMFFLESFYSYCPLFDMVLPRFITYLFLPWSSESQTYYMAHIPLPFLHFTLIGIPSSPIQIVNARITDSSCSFSVFTTPLPLLFLRPFSFLSSILCLSRSNYHTSHIPHHSALPRLIYCRYISCL